MKTVFLSGLHSPFGMALVGNELYVADTDALMSFDYTTGAKQNHRHWAKARRICPPARSITIGRRMLSRTAQASISTSRSAPNSNAGENGIEAESERARILEFDVDSGHLRPYATGLRNANGLSWQPDSGALWTAVNERDDLGNNLVPDYMTEVKAGAFYGFPYSYYGQHVDTRVKPQRPDLVATAIVPDYALGNPRLRWDWSFTNQKLLSGALLGRRFRGSARIMEPQAAHRLQSDLCAIRSWQTCRSP